jgi:glycosyltransferase involved in cell wall biosynthesis
MAAEELKSTECKIVFSHEWWGILGEALTEDRLLSREPGYFSIVNVHGATIWAESYIKNRNLSYGDTILDLQERQGFYFADAAVFPSYYMESFHRVRLVCAVLCCSVLCCAVLCSDAAFLQNVNKWVMQPASHVIPNIMKVGNTASLRNNVKPFRGIGFIGGLEYRKALDVVVDAMHHVKVPKELIPFPVHVYGPKGRGWDKINGISSAEYINRSCTASPHIECIFRGFMRTEDMWADMVKRELIFIMASRKENQPMAILEAASNRLPVIILRKGYSDEMLTEKGVSECIIPHSVEALGNRLQVVCINRSGVAYIHICYV